METTVTQQPFTKAVDDELCNAVQGSYEAWRKANPDVYIHDWLVRLPDDVYHGAVEEDTNCAIWLAWVAFWDWFQFRSRVLLAETAEKKESAELEMEIALAEYRERHSKKLASSQAVS